MKIQTRITLVFFALGSVGLVLLNASIFFFASEFNFEDFFKRLEARVNLTATIRITPGENSAAYEEVRNRHLEKLEGERDFVIKLDPVTGKIPKPIPLPDEFYQKILSAGKARHSEENRFYAGSLFRRPGATYIVIVAANDPYGFKELENLKAILVVSFFVFIGLTWIAGTVFSHYTIRPLRSIIGSVKRISADNLHSRLDEVRGRDELAELVQTFNNMLTRLETAFETQNNFVSNASHELRTPLAIMTSETELMLASTALDAETRSSAKTILGEAEKLKHILSSLLGLAQSGFDGKKQNWQIIRVDELLLEASDSVKQIDPESRIELDFGSLPADERRLCVAGNTNLLKLAISNILLNGCKYSENKPVAVKLSEESGRIVIAVTDLGIGIPEAEQQHIFEPFFRGSNTGRFEGHGIGLPLTLNIVRLHKGSIGIRSKVGQGTEIRVLLPVSA